MILSSFFGRRDEDRKALGDHRSGERGAAKVPERAPGHIVHENHRNQNSVALHWWWLKNWITKVMWCFMAL